MCGRLVLHTPPAHLARFLDATLDLGLAAAATPSWNLPPTHLLYGVTHEPDGNRRMSAYRWGLVPRWAKSSTSTAHTINARSESVAEKPSYRGPFASQPCAIPVNGFYEWESRDGHAKQPYYFSRVDDELMILAGLYDLWYDPTLGPAAPALITCTIVTTEANENMGGLHDRIPVILEPSEVAIWIAPHNVEGRTTLLRPAARGTLRHHAVTPLVGSVRHDRPELLDSYQPPTLF
ncbi:MAG: SOS response-associated peptidase [Actinomycetota bacterium]